MVKTFANASGMKRLLSNSACPAVLRQTLPIINRSWAMDEGLHIEEDHVYPNIVKGYQRLIGDMPGLADALKRYFSSTGQHDHSVPTKVWSTPSVTIGRTKFSPVTVQQKESRIIYLDHQQVPVAGEIQIVFKLGKGSDTYLIGVRRYLPAPLDAANPLTAFPEFGAIVVLSALGDLEIIPATTSIHCSTSLAASWKTNTLIVKNTSRI